MLQKRGIERNIDWVTFSLYLTLVMLGWAMIYSVGYEEGQNVFELRSSAGKQAIWTFISFAVMGMVMLLDWKFWQTFAYPIYATTLVLLVGVLLFGVTIKGATSWYSIAGFRIQPSEIAKVGTCIALAAYLSSAGTDLKRWQAQFICLAFLVVPMALIVLQPDPGSALVFLSFLILLYREGFPSIYYILGISLAVLLVLGLITEDPRLIWIMLLGAGSLWLGSILFKNAPLYLGVVAILCIGFWLAARQAIIDPKISMISVGSLFLGLGAYYTYKHSPRFPGLLAGALFVCGLVAYGANYSFNEILKPHQQDRINVWLQPDKCDPRGSLYNLIQSKMAISSGGPTGKGFLQGTMTRLDYVPEQSTDFIFTTIGEEQGFVGVLLVVGFFLAFLLQIIRIAERQRSAFSRIYAYGFAGIVFFHVFVNIGMTMGLAPVIGIPLPFVSRGGSSLLGFTIMLGILLKLDSKRFQI